jgi:hypothetical protein
MDLRFFVDPETGQPHIHNHGVTEAEVREVLAKRGEERWAADGARIKSAQTAAGRYLKVVYGLDKHPDELFVITAFAMRGKARKGFRTRQRRKGR